MNLDIASQEAMRKLIADAVKSILAELTRKARVTVRATEDILTSARWIITTTTGGQPAGEKGAYVETIVAEAISILNKSFAKVIEDLITEEELFDHDGEVIKMVIRAYTDVYHTLRGLEDEQG